MPALTDPILDLAMGAAFNRGTEFLAETMAPRGRAGGAIYNNATDSWKFKYTKISKSNAQGGGGRSLRWPAGQPATPRTVDLGEGEGEIKRYATSCVLPGVTVRMFQDRGIDVVDRDFVVRTLSNDLLVDREDRLSTALATLTNGLTNTVAGDRWSDASSDPIGQFVTGANEIKQKFGEFPDFAGFSKAYFDLLQSHPSVVGLLGANDLAVLDASTLSRILSARVYGYAMSEDDPARPNIEVRVGTATHSSSKDGQAASLDYVISTGAWLMRRPDVNGNGMTSQEAYGALKQFEPADGEISGEPTSETYDNVDLGTVTTRVAMGQGFEVTDNDASYFFKGVGTAGA